MTDSRRAPSPLKRLLAAALAPLLVLAPALNALAGPVETRVAAPESAPSAAVAPVSAALRGLEGLPVLPTSAVSSALAPAAAAADAPIPPAAASQAAAASPAVAVRLPATRAEAARAFRAFTRHLRSIPAPAAAELSGAKLFDGRAEKPSLAAESAWPGESDSFPRRTAAPQPPARRGIALDADPANPDSIEAALRAFVDSRPDVFRAPSSQLSKVSVSVLPEIQPGQGRSILAVFRQTLEGTDKQGPYHLAIEGGVLSFHIKAFQDGKPVIQAVTNKLVGGVDPSVMTASYDDEQLLAIAARRARLPPDAMRPGEEGLFAFARRLRTMKPLGASFASPQAGPLFVTRQLTDEIGEAWRAVNIYLAPAPDGKTAAVVIVDVKSGEAFSVSAGGGKAHDEEGGAADAEPEIAGTVYGRGNVPTPDGGDHGPIEPMPLPLTNVYDESGKVVAVTDENGNFEIPETGGSQPVKLTIRLASPLVPFVKDENAERNGPIEVTVLAKPGERLTVTLNPVGDDPERSANVVGYVSYLKHHAWMKNLPGMDAARMDIPLAGGMIVNGHEEPGNAFYDPSKDSVNLMAAATIRVKDSHGNLVDLQAGNSGLFWSIEDHEDTHRDEQLFGQLALTPEQAQSPAYRFVKWLMSPIVGADVNESLADVVSYFMRKASTIGQGFIITPAGRSVYIRSALDKTPYDPRNPDPHNGVLAQAMWRIRDGFIAALGHEVGEAYANAMIPVLIIAQPLTPVHALLHLLLWDLREDGSSPFGALIRRIALQDHGIPLPEIKGAPPPRA